MAMAPPRTSPNPDNISPDDLQTVIACTPHQQSHDRLLALKALLLGISQEAVAAIHGVSRRTVQRWIRDFNRSGVDGLIEGRRSGRPASLGDDHGERIDAALADPTSAGHHHWTIRKLHGWLREELQVEVGYSTLVRYVRSRGWRRKVPRTWPNRQDEGLRQAFCERLEGLVGDPEVELWFCDESGFEGDPRPRQRWAKRGSRARVTKNGDHLRMNVAGVVCPRSGEAFFCEFTHMDTDCFQAYLDEANRCLFEGEKAGVVRRERQVMVMDNATWHKSRGLCWGRFEPMYLPPYSPDLNVIERLWLLVKVEHFADFVAKDKGELVAQLDKALLWAMARGEENSRTCAITTKL